MTDYSKLFSAISTLYAQENKPNLIPTQGEFPFPEMYPGQLKVIGELNRFSEAALTSHTGSGKTAVFLSLTRNIPTLIIEPRKFLQKQVHTYYSDFILFGKSEYPCKHARNAAIAPCQRRISCETTNHINSCTKAKETCMVKPCKIFVTEDGYTRYPCEGCAYIAAVQHAMRVLKNKGTVICNFGNFWNLMKLADVIVVDEADLFFREISSPTKMHYSNSKQNSEDSVKDLLLREHKQLSEALKRSDAKSAYSIQNMLYTIDFLNAYADLCFKYQKKDRIYVEVSPDNVGILKDKLFKGKRLLIVSATLGDFDIPQHSYSVWQRRGIFFKPVGKMTSRNLALQPWLMANAAKQIEDISGISEVKYDTKQFVVHAGNIGTHGTALNELLGKDECVLHERGNLMNTIDTFTNSDKRYLIVASAEYGADFHWCKVQFVLKFPFASLDERMRVLEKTMGKDKFNRFYLNDARTRFIQQCGRNVRGYGDFGATVVMDSKFMEDYRMNERLYPEWFREGFDGKVY